MCGTSREAFSSRVKKTTKTNKHTADRPWETSDCEGTSALPQLTVDGPSCFDAVVDSFKPKTGIGVDADSSINVVSHLRKG